MSDTAAVQRSASLTDTRAWIEGEVAQVESLIEAMPSEAQERYRADSHPHNALRVLDAFEKLVCDHWSPGQAEHILSEIG